jgi:hypothetical protein
MNGSSAIALAGPVAPATVPLLAGAGIVAAGVALATGGRATARAAVRSTPEMYPFGPAWLQLGLYLLITLGAAAVAHALLVAYAGADSSGAAASPNGSLPSDLLLGAGSLVLWVLALYAVYGLRRFILMGRELDARRGMDPFGSAAPPDEAGEAPWTPPRRPAGPALRGAVAVIATVTVVVMIEVSVGIQLLETPIGPVQSGVFWWSQLLTIAAAAVVTATVRMIDRGVRDLERQYDLRDAVPRPTAGGLERPPSEGFVP